VNKGKRRKNILDRAGFFLLYRDKIKEVEGKAIEILRRSE
jgi:hypothetical protein